MISSKTMVSLLWSLIVTALFILKETLAIHVLGTGTTTIGDHINALARPLDDCKLFYGESIQHETNPFNLWISCGKARDGYGGYSEGDFVLRSASVSKGIVWQHWDFSLVEGSLDGVLIEYDDGEMFSHMNYLFAMGQYVVETIDFKKGTTMKGTITESAVDITIEGETRFGEHEFHIHVISDQGFRLDIIAPDDSSGSDSAAGSGSDPPTSDNAKDAIDDGHCVGSPRDCLSKTGVGCSRLTGGNGKSYPTGCTVNIRDDLWQECVGVPLPCNVYDEIQICYMVGCDWQWEFDSAGGNDGDGSNNNSNDNDNEKGKNSTQYEDNESKGEESKSDSKNTGAMAGVLVAAFLLFSGSIVFFYYSKKVASLATPSQVGEGTTQGNEASIPEHRPVKSAAAPDGHQMPESGHDV